MGNHLIYLREGFNQVYLECIMISSTSVRKVIVLVSYLLVTAISFICSDTLIISTPINTILRLVGITLFILTLISAIRIHSIYPEKHDKPLDFPELITNGPYSICRHPFYGVLILNQYSIALTLLSLYGLIITTALLPFWLFLIKIEERELI